MLRWALLFLIIAIVAALFGFGIVVNTSILAAKYLFIAFIVLFVVSLIAGATRGRGTI